MARVQTKVILETIKSTKDNVNWLDGTEHSFEVSVIEQEHGLESVVTLPEDCSLKIFTLSEIEALLKAMKVADHMIGEE